jgi:hypothetical protein
VLKHCKDETLRALVEAESDQWQAAAKARARLLADSARKGSQYSVLYGQSLVAAYVERREFLRKLHQNYAEEIRRFYGAPAKGGAGDAAAPRP